MLCKFQEAWFYYSQIDLFDTAILGDSWSAHRLNRLTWDSSFNWLSPIPTKQ